MSLKKSLPILSMLQARFPVAFDKPRRPLAVGIREEVRALVPVEELNEQKLQQALASHTGRVTYLQACLVDGARRIHLDGSDAGEVTEDGKRIAREKLEAIEAQKLARQQKEAERKANPPAPPVKKEKKAQPAKQPVKAVDQPPPAPAKPRKEKAIPVVQIKKRRILVKA
jgi:ProP effector